MRGGLLHRRGVAVRVLAAATVALIACTASTPPSSTPVEQTRASPTPAPTPIPPLKPAHSVSPSPSPSPACVVPVGLEGDPQALALQAQCRAEQAKIQTEKSRLADSLALAQGSSDSLQQMLESSKAR